MLWASFWLLLLASFAPVQAHADEPLVIGNDRGGLLSERLGQLRSLRQQSRPVEIRGRICYSTCTMFLALERLCVSPETIFGFHGPSTYGFPLNEDVFDQASRIIAQHYPPELRDWYMQIGRYRLLGVYRVSGDRIVRMGINSCAE